MNKYEEALEIIDMYDTDNVELHNTDEWALIKQAIAKAEKYEEAMKLGDDEITGDALKIGYETMRNKYNEMIAERDEALKRIKELELSCSYKDEEIRQLQANFDACKHLADKNIELHKRISELEQDNKVLVEGVRALNIHHEEDIEYFDIYDDSGFDYVTFCKGEKNKEQYTKIKEMLELVEVE